MGAKWQALGSLWLCADTALIRSVQTDLSFKEIHQLSIPDVWKEWMFAKAMKIDAPCPLEAVQKGVYRISSWSTSEYTCNRWYRHGPSLVTLGSKWCDGLVLCLYWQAVYSGAGKDWHANFKTY